MQGKGAGPVNRVELESQVLCAALRQSFFGRDKIGSFTSIRELSHLFPDLLPPPEDKESTADSNKTDYYAVLSIRPQTPANGVIAAYLRRVRNFLRSSRVTEARSEYNKILNAGFILRKPRLRLSHDMVVVRRWLFESQEEAKAHAVVETQDHIPVMRTAASTATSNSASAAASTTPTPPAQEPARPIQPPPVPAQQIEPAYEPPVAPQPAEPFPQPYQPQPTQPAVAQQTPTPQPAQAYQALGQPQPVEPYVTPQTQTRQPVEEPYVPPRPVEPPVRPAESEPAPVRTQPVQPAVPPVAVEPVVAQPPITPAPEHVPASQAFAQPKAEEVFVFDEDALRKGDVYTGPMPMIVQLLEAAQFVGPLEVQALRAQMQLAPDIPVEKLILNAGYVTPQEMNSLKLGEQLLAKGKISMAQFQVAIYDERMSGLRMAESLQVRGWLNVEVRNAIEEFQKKRS